MDKNRRFQAISPKRTSSQVIKGHNKGVLGHDESAGSNWNREGHTRPREENMEHNRQTSTYHGIEDRDSSNASGASEERYKSPGPHHGSHPSYWNPQHAKFQGGPWHTWEKESGAQPQAPSLPVPSVPMPASNPLTSLPMPSSQPTSTILPPTLPSVPSLPSSQIPSLPPFPFQPPSQSPVLPAPSTPQPTSNVMGIDDDLQDMLLEGTLADTSTADALIDMLGDQQGSTPSPFSPFPSTIQPPSTPSQPLQSPTQSPFSFSPSATFSPINPNVSFSPYDTDEEEEYYDEDAVEFQQEDDYEDDYYEQDGSDEEIEQFEYQQTPPQTNWAGDSQAEQFSNLMGAAQYGSALDTMSPSDLAALRQRMDEDK